MKGERLEIREILRGGLDLDVFVKPEFAGPLPVPMLIPVRGSTPEEALQMMLASLQTPICDAYAKRLGEGLDARAMGAAMEQRSRSPASTVTEMEVLAAVKPIATAARKFRHAIGRSESTRDGSVLSVAFGPGKVQEIATFRRMLDALCDADDNLKALGWKEQSTRGPRPSGSTDEYIILCFVKAWSAGTGHKVSKAERSRFMKAAFDLLPLHGVELGKDPRGKLVRVIDRLDRTLVAAPLRGVR